MVGHITMANDPFMIDEVNNRINDGKCAEQAIDEVCDMFYAMFDASEEQLIRERCADVQDIRTGILAELLGKELVDLSVLPKDSIVVVHDLTPSMTATIDKENVVGIVTEVGGRTSYLPNHRPRPRDRPCCRSRTLAPSSRTATPSS